MRFNQIALLASLLLASQVQAQNQLTTAGVVVMVPATGEVTHPNEEVIASFAAEAIGKNKEEVTSRVNQKMKEGLAIIRVQDPDAKLQSAAFHNYPQHKKAKQEDESSQLPEVIGWKVTQEVNVTTQNLAGLPKMTAALQGKLGLNNLDFHLTAATTKKLEDQRMATAYRSLHERIASIAAAMGKTVGDATLESITFEGAGKGDSFDGYSGFGRSRAKDDSAEPVFEAGETTLLMNLVGKVKFK